MCHSGALLFPPLLFSGPIQSTLGVLSFRLCPVLCLWPVLCTVVLPSYHNVPLIPLKKKKTMPGGTYLRYHVYSFYLGFYCVSVRGEPNWTITLGIILLYINWKQLLSLCHCFGAKSNHSPLHSWRFKISAVVVCWHYWWSGQQEVQSRQVSLFCLYLSKTPEMHLEIDFPSNLP